VRRFALASFLCLVLGACGGGSDGGSGQKLPGQLSDTLSPIASLGERIFHDQSLSSSGHLACATCHNPDTAHMAPGAGTGAIGTPDGGALLATQGFRKTPSLRYLRYTPAFFFADDGTPTGGFARDGRASSFADQSVEPFLKPHEMDNGTAQALIARARVAAWADDFKKQFGANIFDDVNQAFAQMRYALQQYQKEDPDFAPFTSKYDAFLAGNTQLTDAEMRGLALFNNPVKGNCAACHPSARQADGTPPMFTDFTYDNLGVPRNTAIKANADPSYFDLGLCGPFRTDLVQRTDLCGAFKVPTLRNVAIGGPYFHNGRFATLKEALQFYVQRDTNPEKFYPLLPDGTADKFNDLPAAYHRNVNTEEVPYNRKPGEQPALSDAEIDDLIAFLGTLTDGYTK
jgi:cytochrome c peroxidase